MDEMSEMKQYLCKIGIVVLAVGMMGVVLSFLGGELLRNAIINIAQLRNMDANVYIDMSISTWLSYTLVAVGILMLVCGAIWKNKK